MEVKKTVKYDGKLKGVHIVDDNAVDSDGLIIDLISTFKKAYGEKPFDITTTTKTEEIIDTEDMDLEEDEEVDE